MQTFGHLWAVAAPHFLHVWAIAGPLVGILLGGWLTTKNQRKLWLLDNKREEYRTMLTTLSDCWSHFTFSYGKGRNPDDPQLSASRREATRKLANVTSDRLFIAEHIKKLEVSKRFTRAAKVLKEDRNSHAFSDKVDAIMDDIRKVARRDLS